MYDTQQDLQQTNKQTQAAKAWSEWLVAMHEQEARRRRDKMKATSVTTPLCAANGDIGNKPAPESEKGTPPQAAARTPDETGTE